MTPDQRIALSNAINPFSVKLAEKVSMAPRIPQALLRAARLKYLPAAGPRSEADLWFGPLVETRTSDYIILEADIGRRFRQKLIGFGPPEKQLKRLKQAQKLISEIPGRRLPLIALEQELIFLTLSPKQSDKDAAVNRLRSVIKAIIDQDRTGLCYWAFGLTRRLPELANLDSAVLLEQLAHTRFYGVMHRQEDTTGLVALSDAEQRLLAHGIESVTVGVCLYGDHLEVREPPQTGDALVDVPAGETRALDVFLKGPFTSLVLLGNQGAVFCAAFNPDHSQIVSASEDGTLRVWNAETGNELSVFTGHSGPVHAVAVTADGRRAVSGSGDKTLKVWDMESGKELHTLAGHKSGVNTVAVTADGRRAISGSEDNMLRIWDVDSGNQLSTLTGHSGAVNAVAVTTDGRRIISGSEDNTIKIWDIDSGNELSTLTGHSGAVNVVAITSDNIRIISGSDDRTLKVWELKSGVELISMDGHTDSINSVSVPFDGRRIISASSDNTIRLWNIEKSEALTILRGHKGAVCSVAFSSDETMVVSGSKDGTLRLWQVDYTKIPDSERIRRLRWQPQGTKTIDKISLPLTLGTLGQVTYHLTDHELEVQQLEKKVMSSLVTIHAADGLEAGVGCLAKDNLVVTTSDALHRAGWTGKIDQPRTISQVKFPYLEESVEISNITLPNAHEAEKSDILNNNILVLLHLNSMPGGAKPVRRSFSIDESKTVIIRTTAGSDVNDIKLWWRFNLVRNENDRNYILQPLSEMPVSNFAGIAGSPVLIADTGEALGLTFSEGSSTFLFSWPELTQTFPALQQKKRYKVFVSSTYPDNQEMRRLVQEAITTAGMVWHGMEIFTGSTRPTVKECLRLVREADILIGIIARRYGWIPEGSDISITEMEYEAADQRLMFLLDPSLPFKEEDFDPGEDRWDKQKKLEAFKQRILEDQMPALFTENTLLAKVLKALNDWRAQREGPAQPQEPEEAPSTPDLAEEIRQYKLKADTLHANLPLVGFVTRLNVPIDIEEIYIPLHAMIDLRGVAEEGFADAAQAEALLRKSDVALEIALPEAFRQSRLRGKRGLVILGDPGSGKTTHLKRLLLWCLRKGPESIDLPEEMLPVFLPLRELRDLKRGLDAFIEDQLDSPHLNAAPGFGKRLLQRGNLLLLLDGLDEVADLSQSEKVSQWISQAIKAHPHCRFVVTCRFAGYAPGVRLSEDFLEMHIRPMSREQAERFVENWYRIVERGLAKDPEQGEGIGREKAKHLIERLRAPDFRARRVSELTRNPLLLTNICLVHRHRGGLPHKRARLYEECIDVLLEHWRGAIRLKVVRAQEGRRVLQPAALWLHSEEERTRATAAELTPHIAPALKAVGWQGGGAEDFLRTIRDDSGLLTGWGPDQYGFMHLGFQEYLAALEIRARAFEDPTVLRELAGHFGESWWQEVTLLLLAPEDPSLFVPFMREVLRQPAFATDTSLVELCLDDAAEVSSKPFMELLEIDPGTDKELWQRQLAVLPLIERLDAEALEKIMPRLARHPSAEIQRWVAGRSAQARQDVIVNELAGYELVRIPQGVFLMGSPGSEEGRKDTEEPQHKVRVQSFYLGRYPVTNAQYGRYLNANPDAVKPEYWADRRFNQPRQPVVGVSWNEAQEYAVWAGLRLPTEAEWEYACRAKTTTRYYTGNTNKDLTRAGWYDFNSSDIIHPVGKKEANTFGLHDMHGNVWEWVEDDYHSNYSDAPDDGRAWIDEPRRGTSRVIRGGSCYDDAKYCRSAARDKYEPIYRINDVGFRLASSISPGF